MAFMKNNGNHEDGFRPSGNRARTHFFVAPVLRLCYSKGEFPKKGEI